jgi:hypothetical protein
MLAADQARHVLRHVYQILEPGSVLSIMGQVPRQLASVPAGDCGGQYLRSEYLKGGVSLYGARA